MFLFLFYWCNKDVTRTGQAQSIFYSPLFSSRQQRQHHYIHALCEKQLLTFTNVVYACAIQPFQNQFLTVHSALLHKANTNLSIYHYDLCFIRTDHLDSFVIFVRFCLQNITALMTQFKKAKKCKMKYERTDGPSFSRCQYLISKPAALGH